jgi:hypothetical protein
LAFWLLVERHTTIDTSDRDVAQDSIGIKSCQSEAAIAVSPSRA